jgi:hypothetical protein
MTCVELEDRLFDEDCRSALLGRGDVPRDVADHLARCLDCPRAWSRAAAEAGWLSRGLVVAPPPALRDRLVRAFRADAGRRRHGIGSGTEMVCGALACGALGASLAGSVPGLSDWAGFCVGASLGLAAEAVRRTRRIWREPVAALRGVLRRCLAQLSQIA